MSSSSPVVAATTACSGSRPVAKAFGDGSGMTNTRGIGMPVAIARFSTVRHSRGSDVRSISMPPAIAVACRAASEVLQHRVPEGDHQDDEADRDVAGEVPAEEPERADDQQEHQDDQDGVALVARDGAVHVRRWPTLGQNWTRGGSAIAAGSVVSKKDASVNPRRLANVEFGNTRIFVFSSRTPPL